MAGLLSLRPTCGLLAPWPVKPSEGRLGRLALERTVGVTGSVVGGGRGLELVDPMSSA